ncbi:MAG: hypothetical protein JF617_14615 [Burkholderiales bacterium]|jgi:hypothetical protein|nr:hypothetical protein [Burkholderiales bacterium]
MSSPSLPLFKIPGAILAHAKGLIAGGETKAAQTMAEDQAFAPRSEMGAGGEPTPQDKTFWASMAAADRRLAELRRAIDQAAAEAMVREADAKAPPSPDVQFAESRCETAKRVIADALDAEKS